LAALAQHICPDLKHCQPHETLWVGLEAAVNLPEQPPAQFTVKTPLNPPLLRGEARNSCSLPLPRGGLGWGEDVELGEKDSWKSSNKPLVVFCGSLYLIGDFFAHLQSNGDPKTLR
jgi:hypothetical protein